MQEPETFSTIISLSGPARPDSDPAKRLEKYGLFRLYPGSEEAEVTFGPDIIAVHGLNGDAYETWTHDNRKLWLRDFLPTNMPNSRIFTFGYNSEVAFTKSKGTVDQFARSLLNALKRVRRGEASQLCSLLIIHEKLKLSDVEAPKSAVDLCLPQYGRYCSQASKLHIFPSYQNTRLMIIP